MIDFIKKWECDVNCVCDTHPFRWVNEKAKMIWWEVPRCGSSRIAASIDRKLWTRLTFNNVNTIKYSDYFNFAVQTNPWRRVASCYWLFNNYSGRIAEGKKLGANKPFPQFIDDMFEEGHRNHHWYPVSCYFPPEDVKFDYTIIPLEDLTEEWNKIAKEHNQNEMIARLKRDAHNPKPWRESYKNSPTAIDIVAEHYKEDIQRFNHSFEKKE